MHDQADADTRTYPNPEGGYRHLQCVAQRIDDLEGRPSLFICHVNHDRTLPYMLDPKYSFDASLYITPLKELVYGQFYKILLTLLIIYSVMN